MSFSIFFCILVIIFSLIVLFFFASKKAISDNLNSSVFECGFSSSFFSRFSFSIHYFLVALIFLFLDLELCFLMPLMNCLISHLETFFVFFFFVLILLVGLILEWTEKKLDWIF